MTHFTFTAIVLYFYRLSLENDILYFYILSLESDIYCIQGESLLWLQTISQPSPQYC